MKIEIPDELAQTAGVTEREALELLVIAIYKAKGIHGTLAGKMLGISEFEFHRLLPAHGETVNYGMQDIIDDIKNNDELRPGVRAAAVRAAGPQGVQRGGADGHQTAVRAPG